MFSPTWQLDSVFTHPMSSEAVIFVSKSKLELTMNKHSFGQFDHNCCRLSLAVIRIKLL